MKGAMTESLCWSQWQNILLFSVARKYNKCELLYHLQASTWNSFSFGSFLLQTYRAGYIEALKQNIKEAKLVQSLEEILQTSQFHILGLQNM